MAKLTKLIKLVSEKSEKSEKVSKAKDRIRKYLQKTCGSFASAGFLFMSPHREFCFFWVERLL